MKKVPILIGDSQHLFAMQVLPDVSNTSRCAVIVLNAGLLHHVGPFRMHAELAQRLTALGHAVICVDQSGKGESLRRKGISRQESLLLDYDEVLGSLSQFGVDCSAIVGLCSGADDASFIASCRDNVRGIVLMDGYARKDARFHAIRIFNRYVKKIASPRAWRTLLKGRDPSRWRNADMRTWGSEAEMIGQYEKMLNRGGRILALFAGGEEYYNYEGQLGNGLPPSTKLSNLREIFNNHANHTYVLAKHRKQMLNQIVDWFPEEITGVGNR